MCVADDRPCLELVKPWLLALALTLSFGLPRASAETVIVQGAPPGSTIELTQNTATVATGTVSNFGDVTLTVARTGEANVLLFIDACPGVTRVHMVNRGVQPPPSPAGCNRADAGSVFVVQSITTFVVDMSPSPSVHITQGPAPSAWLREGSSAPSRQTILGGKAGKDLVVSAGAGTSKFSDSAAKACGDASPCSSVNVGLATVFGAEYWITRNIAAHVAYLKPADVTASGSGTAYNFDTRIQARLLTVGAAAGVTLGPTRLYGLGGLNRHEATLTTTETVSDTTVVVDNVTQTIKGGTQSFAVKTSGWNWFAGGGIEAWLNRWLGVYAELDVAKVKGAPTSGGEGGIDDMAMFALGGARLHLGR